jgi:1-acyl-sn-glycerol-3-phosphate acyltransferase
MSTHAWFPVSPCGPACRDGEGASVGAVRAAARMIAGLFVLLLAVVVSPLPAVLPKVAVRVVFRAVLLAFGVRLRVRGDLAVTRGRGAFVVANHVSWLDIVAVNAVRPMRSVAKKEIGGWPVLGRLTAAAGTVFVDRERLRALPGTVFELATALRGGAVITPTRRAPRGAARRSAGSSRRCSRPRWTRACPSGRWRCGSLWTVASRPSPRSSATTRSSTAFGEWPGCVDWCWR